jgi:hypothetical protein
VNTLHKGDGGGGDDDDDDDADGDGDNDYNNNHQRRTLNRCSSFQMPQLSQCRHRGGPEEYRLEGTAYKNTPTENGALNTFSTVHNGHYSNRLQESLQLLSIRPALCILMQKTAIHNACREVRQFLAEQ